MPHPRNRLRALVVAATALAITMTTMATAAQASPSVSDLTKQITTASNQLEVVIESYNAMNISLTQTVNEQKQLQASLAPTQAALAIATAQVGTIAANSYQEGRIGPVTALLEGGGQSNLMDRLRFLDQIRRSNQRDITTFTAATQTYGARQAVLKTTQAKQTAQRAALAARKTQIEGQIKKLKAMRRAAGLSDASGSSYTGAIPSISGSAGVAVTFAFKQIGKSYDYGADGPSTYDCSGLTMAAWKAAGKSLPHNAAAQWGVVAHISRSQLKAGDLVFYNSLAHVGIYVGSNMIIDAPTYGEDVDERSINRGMPIYGYGRVT